MGGSTSPATTTQTSKTELSPQQNDIFNMAMPYAKQYASTPISQYGGSGIAPFNPNETGAQQTALGAMVPAQGLADESAAAQHKMLDPSFMLDPANNQYLQNAMHANTDETTRMLTEGALPALRSGSTQAGGMYSGGSTKSGVAEGLATGKTAQAISENNTKMLFDAYNRGLGGMQTAIGQNGQVQGQQLMPAEIQGAVGDQQRQMQQSQLDEQIKKFYGGQQLPFLQAQELMSFLQGMPGATNTSTSTGSTPQASPASQALGYGTGALGLGSLLKLLIPGGSFGSAG